MRKSIFFIVLGIFYSLLLSAQQESDHFYYCFGEKILFQQRTDKIYLKFAQMAKTEQLRTLIKCDTLLQPTNYIHLDESPLRFAILEAKDGKPIPSETIQSFKEREDIVSVTYLYLYDDVYFQGLTDEFVVKLKETTSYEKMQKLAELNDCVVGSEDRYVKNQYMLYVSKTSKLDALQLSNLFYETGLFEFVEPNFVVLNSSHNGTSFGQQWGLQNTGQSGGTVGIDINVLKAWNITRGDKNIRVAVIDNGIDLTHPDLQANLIQGFDVLGQNTAGAPVSIDDNHGTPCAGIIGARGVEISGVAPNCSIMPIRAYTGSNYSYIYVATAINEAVQRGADIISHSWGGGATNTNVTKCYS